MPMPPAKAESTPVQPGAAASLRSACWPGCGMSGGCLGPVCLLSGGCLGAVCGLSGRCRGHACGRWRGVPRLARRRGREGPEKCPAEAWPVLRAGGRPCLSSWKGGKFRKDLHGFHFQNGCRAERSLDASLFGFRHSGFRHSGFRHADFLYAGFLVCRGLRLPSGSRGSKDRGA